MLAERRGCGIESIVLFGSLARGDWLPGSDYDVLVGLSVDDGARLHPLLREALQDGVVLSDRGSVAAMQERFEQWRHDGIVRRWRQGWKIAHVADRGGREAAS